MTKGCITKARARKRTSFLFFCWLVIGLCACSPGLSPQVKFAGSTMGTSYHITLVGEVADQAALQAQIDARLRLVNAQMSTYQPESELMQVNGAGLEQPIALSQALYYVLEQSERIHRLSDGAFDVTVGPLVNRWGFGPVEQQGLPDAAEIEALRAMVGQHKLTLDAAGRTLRKSAPVFIDLSAIAKGYGVDQVAELLTALGYQNFLVEIGGELRVAGLNARGEPWRIAIERPQLAQGSVQATMGVSDRSVATSGSYRNFVMAGNTRYSHTIDPVTGMPINHNLVSVTVVAENCTEADGLATAFHVLGAERALQLADRLGVAIFLLEERDGGIVESWNQDFAPYLQTTVVH